MQFVRRCTRSLCLYSLALPPYISTLPSPYLFFRLFINEYTTLDTKDLTSNELGNPFSHFWLPIPQLCFFFFLFQRRRRGERLTDTELPLFICPLALGARVAGTIGRRLEEIKRVCRYLAPEDAPWHSQLNQPARKKCPGTVNQNNLPRLGGFLKGAPLLL